MLSPIPAFSMRDDALFDMRLPDEMRLSKKQNLSDTSNSSPSRTGFGFGPIQSGQTILQLKWANPIQNTATFSIKGLTLVSG